MTRPMTDRKLKIPREPRKELTKDDIKEGKSYRGKYPGTIRGKVNDRTVIHISAFRTHVQYDSSAVSDGQQYPTVSIEAFLKWASHEVF